MEAADDSKNETDVPEDKKSFAGIPEADFVVITPLLSSNFHPHELHNLQIPGDASSLSAMLITCLLDNFSTL